MTLYTLNPETSVYIGILLLMCPWFYFGRTVQNPEGNLIRMRHSPPKKVQGSGGSDTSQSGHRRKQNAKPRVLISPEKHPMSSSFLQKAVSPTQLMQDVALSTVSYISCLHWVYFRPKKKASDWPCRTGLNQSQHMSVWYLTGTQPFRTMESERLNLFFSYYICIPHELQGLPLVE